MKKLIATVAAALLVSVGFAGVAAAAPGDTLECPICQTETAAYSGPLNEGEIEGLLLSLNDEYHAWAIYDQVIADFGEVRPFTNIRSSETQHISRVVDLLESYGVPVPENPWPGQVPQFDSVGDAAAAAAQAEIDNAGLYDRLFASTDREDILLVYENLQRASLENHLPAFERAAGSTAPTGTTGADMGPRWAR